MNEANKSIQQIRAELESFRTSMRLQFTLLEMRISMLNLERRRRSFYEGLIEGRAQRD